MKVSESIGGGMPRFLNRAPFNSVHFCGHLTRKSELLTVLTDCSGLVGRIINRGAPHANHPNTTSIKISCMFGGVYPFLKKKVNPQQSPRTGQRIAACISNKKNLIIIQISIYIYSKIQSQFFLFIYFSNCLVMFLFVSKIVNCHLRYKSILRFFLVKQT